MPNQIRLRLTLGCIILTILLLSSPRVILSQNEQSPAFAIDWRPDGSNQLAVGYQNGIVKIVDSTGQELQSFDVATGLLSTIAWSPDGNKLAVVMNNGRIFIIEVATNTVITTTVRTAETVAWSPDSTMIATDGFGVGELPGVLVLDASTGELVGTIIGLHDGAVGPVVWHPIDNTLVTSGSYHGTIVIGNAVSFERLRRWSVSPIEESVTALAWSPDGSNLVSGSGGGTLKVWDPTTGEIILRTSQVGVVKSIEWSPDGTQFASIGENIV